MTQPLLADYFPILVFMAVAAGIAAAMVGGSLLLARQKPNPEKLSTYECGFEPFDDTRRRFDVRFYLVAILFIIFDLEVAFLFPWAVALGEVGWFGFCRASSRLPPTIAAAIPPATPRKTSMGK